MKYFCVLALVIALVVAPIAAAQKRPDSELLANFIGTLKGTGKNSLTLEEENGNEVEFNCSRKTHYYDGTKRIKPSELKPGERISVEAKRALDGSLDAVNVRRGK